MGEIPRLTTMSRPAVELGHRCFAMPLIEAIRSIGDKVDAELAQGRITEARALVSVLRRTANEQEQWTIEVLAADDAARAERSST